MNYSKEDEVGGFKAPVVTTLQRLAIVGVATGTTVYDSDLGTLCFYNGSAWYKVTAEAAD